MLPTIIAGLAILIVSVIIHETAHGYAALAQGDQTARLAGRLTLNPLAHLDPIGSVLVPLALFALGAPVFGWAKPVPYNPYNLRDQRWGPAFVALAGPVSNFFLALVFSLLWRGGWQNELILLAVFINLTLAVFNLIPIAPLDGSKILFALIPVRYRAIQTWLERHQLLFFLIILILIANTTILEQAVTSLFRLFTGASL